MYEAEVLRSRDTSFVMILGVRAGNVSWTGHMRSALWKFRRASSCLLRRKTVSWTFLRNIFIKFGLIFKDEPPSNINRKAIIMSVTRVAIAAMTGKFARLITTHLLSKPNVEIRGFCRTPSKVPREISSDPRVRIFEASSTDTEKIREAIRGTEICICCYLGDESLMEAGQKELINACIAEKIPRFMDSGYTFDYRSLEMGAAPQKDFCKKIQAYLEQKTDQIKAVQILNGAFMEVCFASFYGLFSPDGPTLQYWGSGDEKLEMTTYEDAAKFAAEVALDKKAIGYQSGEAKFLSPLNSSLLMVCNSARRSKERQRYCRCYRSRIRRSCSPQAIWVVGRLVRDNESQDDRGTRKRICLDGNELYLPWAEWVDLPSEEFGHGSLSGPESHQARGVLEQIRYQQSE